MEWRRGRAYSQDLRQRVLAAVDSARVVAARFGVSVSYVIKARQRRDRHGETTARPQRSHTPRLLAPLHAAIAAHVAQFPDATLDELRAWLGAEHGVSVSLGLVWKTLRRLDLTRKKRRFGRPSRIGPRSPPPVATGACSRAA